MKRSMRMFGGVMLMALFGTVLLRAGGLPHGADYAVEPILKTLAVHMDAADAALAAAPRAGWGGYDRAVAELRADAEALANVRPTEEGRALQRAAVAAEKFLMRLERQAAAMRAS